MGQKKLSTKVQGLRDARRRIKHVIAKLTERDPKLLEQWLRTGEREGREIREKQRT